MSATNKNIFQALLFICLCIYAGGAQAPAADAAATDNATPAQQEHAPADIQAAKNSYTVQQGDCLGKILREVYKLPDAIIFSPQTTITVQEANPHIHNVNDLHAGQKLIVPIQILEHTARKNTNSAGHKQAAPTAAKQAVRPGAFPGNEQSDSSDNTATGFTGHAQSQRAPEQPIHLETDESSIRETSLAGADAQLYEKKIRAMLFDFTKAFEGSDNASCVKTLPIENGGTVVMDCNQFPIYAFPWGGKIILDYGEKMPAAIRNIITMQWEHTDIISAGFHEDVETVFARVIDGCGLHKIESGDHFIVSRNNVQISVSGNWIVYKDNLQKNIFVVSIAHDSCHRVPDSLTAYLAGVGINLVYLGSEEKQPSATIGSYSPVYQATQVQPDPVRMTDMILELLGINFQKNKKTKIIPQNADGITFEVTIDRKFTLAGKTFFIDFKNLSPNIADMLSNNGFKIIQIDVKNNDYIKLIQELIDFCGVHNTSFPAHFQYDQSEKTSIKISVPGFLLHTKSGDIMLTNVDFDKYLSKFLSELDIKVIKF